MPTGLTIRQELLKWGIITFLGTISEDSVASDYIRDSLRLAGRSIDYDSLKGSAIRLIDTQATPGAPGGEVAHIDGIEPASGTVWVSPALTANPGEAAGATINYEIYRPGIEPDDVDRARDDALTDMCSQWYLHPISIFPNSAYVDTLEATNWEALGGGSIAKQTMIFPYEFSRDSLLGTNAATNEGAESASVYVQPSKRFYAWIPVSAQTGTAEVVVYDKTSGAEISLNGDATSVGRGWTAIEVTGTIPSDCYEITVRLQGQESNAVVEWGPLCFHWQDQRVIGLPARVLTTDSVGPVSYYVNPTTASQPQDWNEEDMQEWPGVRVEQTSDNVKLRFTHPLGEFPYFYLERTFFSALNTGGYFTAANRRTGDVATTLCPTDYVVPNMVHLLALQYRNLDPDFWDGVLARANYLIGVRERQYGPTPRPRIERAREFRVPNLRI